MAYPKVNLRKIKRKKGYSYFIDYALNGKRYRKVVEGNKYTAEQIKNEVQRRLSLGQFDIFTEKPEIISFDRLYTEYIAVKKNIIRDASVKRYKNHCDRFSGFMKDNFKDAFNDISLIKREYIKEFLDDCLDVDTEYGKTWNRKTVNGCRDLLSSIFNYAASKNKKYLKNNPVEGIRKYPQNSKKVDFFSDDELKNIWDIVDQYWKPFLEFILYTGLRKGETINLVWNQVNLDSDNPSITIESREDWQTKTGYHRTIPLNEKAMEILHKQKEVASNEYVFISRQGKKVPPDAPYHAIKNAVNELKLEGDVHKLRHTFASKLVMAGESLYTVGKLLGHTNSKTTEIYAHLSPDHLRSAVNKIK
jgi:integrase